MFGENNAEIISKVQQTFKDDVMSTSWINKGYNRFEDGQLL